MTSQIRRSSASIAANIAEGHGRENTGSFIQFLRIAQGSLKELETHLILSARVGLLSEAELTKPLKSGRDRKDAPFDGTQSAAENTMMNLFYSLFAIRYSPLCGVLS